MTALIAAAKAGLLSEVVKLLNENQSEIDINAVDEKGLNALHWVAKSGYEDIAEALLEHGAQVDTKDENYCTALHYAAEKNHVKVINTLLNHQANANVKGGYKLTPLYKAVEKGHLESVRVLLERGANVNRRCGQKRRFSKETLLIVACTKGYTEIVTELLKHRAAVNERNWSGETALLCAAIENHIDIVKMLIKHGADKNLCDSHHNFPQALAAAKGNQEISELLGFERTSINNDLFNACWHGDAEKAIELLNQGADITISNELGMTVLYAAAWIGNVAIVQELFKNPGIKINRANKMGHTPLHATVLNISHININDCLEVIEILLAQGANINKKDIQGKTPLHIAAEMKHEKIVRFLLDKGADISIDFNDTIVVANIYPNKVSLLKEAKSKALEPSPAMDTTQNSKPAEPVALKSPLTESELGELQIQQEDKQDQEQYLVKLKRQQTIQDLKTQFLTAYDKKLIKNNRAYCGLYSLFSRSNLPRDKSLKDMIEHAQGRSAQGTGFRSREVMKSLGWLNAKNEVSDELMLTLTSF